MPSPNDRNCAAFFFQVIHGTSTLDTPKVDSARDRMLDVNPHIKVETFHEQLTSENVLGIVDGYDVVSRLPHTTEDNPRVASNDFQS